MTFAPVHGRKADVSINGELLGGFCDSITLSSDTDVVTLEVMGATDKTKLSGQSTGTLNLSGFYDPTATTGPMAVLSGLNQNDAVPCIYYPGGNVTGQYIGTFNAILKSFKPGSKVAGAVSFTADFEVTGAIVWTVHT